MKKSELERVLGLIRQSLVHAREIGSSREGFFFAWFRTKENHPYEKFLLKEEVISPVRTKVQNPAVTKFGCILLSQTRMTAQNDQEIGFYELIPAQADMVMSYWPD